MYVLHNKLYHIINTFGVCTIIKAIIIKFVSKSVFFWGENWIYGKFYTNVSFKMSKIYH